MERLQRTQILLEPEQHRELTRIAEDEGRSLSDVVREIVQAELTRRQEDRDADRQRRLGALERIRQHREQILAERGGKPLDFDIIEAIEQSREEQDARNFNLFADPGR